MILVRLRCNGACIIILFIGSVVNFEVNVREYAYGIAMLTAMLILKL